MAHLELTSENKAG